MATRGGGVIAPVGEKLLFEHTKFSATRGDDHPYHHHPCIRHCYVISLLGLPCKVGLLSEPFHNYELSQACDKMP